MTREDEQMSECESVNKTNPLYALMASPKVERAYQQGYERGKRDAEMAHQQQQLPEKPMTYKEQRWRAYEEGLRRRAKYWLARSGIAMALGDEERARQLEKWAQNEQKRLDDLLRLRKAGLG